MPSPLHADVLQLLDQLPPYREDEVFALTNSLRKEGWQPDIISQALTQARLREKAVPKLGERASKMLFTSDALGQASRPEAAAHHAQVFLDVGVHSLREVGCGIGADTTAFAIAGLTVTARELDNDRALLARHNLADFDNVRIEVADGLADISEEGMWADPARRGTKGRISNPEEWMPALSQVVEAARGVRLAGIKVAPGIDYSHLPPGSRVEWLSIGRDLVEAIIWLGTDRPGRVATLLGKDQLTIDTAPDSAAEMVDAGELGTYLYEPDPAVIRAGGIAGLCRRFDLAPVAPGIAYLTSDALVDSPFLEAFTVQEVLPLQEKKLARELKSRSIGTLEIKKRGVDVAPEDLRKKLKLTGDASATIILTPLLHGRHAILATRI